MGNRPSSTLPVALAYRLVGVRRREPRESGKRIINVVWIFNYALSMKIR